MFHKSTEIRQEARGGERQEARRRSAKDDDETGEAAADCGFEEQLFRFRFKTITCCPTLAVLAFLKEGLNKGQNHLISVQQIPIPTFLKGTDFSVSSGGGSRGANLC